VAHLTVRAVAGPAGGQQGGQDGTADGAGQVGGASGQTPAAAVSWSRAVSKAVVKLARSGRLRRPGQVPADVNTPTAGSGRTPTFLPACRLAGYPGLTIRRITLGVCGAVAPPPVDWLPYGLSATSGAVACHGPGGGMGHQGDTSPKLTRSG
jgi:hypothetical protein